MRQSGYSTRPESEYPSGYPGSNPGAGASTMITLLDCYTDEPSGLGVPPYLGTYPRYIAGYLNEDVYYLTIDDLRLWKKHNSVVKDTRLSQSSLSLGTYL